MLFETGVCLILKISLKLPFSNWQNGAELFATRVHNYTGYGIEVDI